MKRKTLLLFLIINFGVFISACVNQNTSTSIITKNSLPQPTGEPTITETMVLLDPVIVPVLCTLKDRPYDRFFPRNTPIIFSWGWEAKTRELINDFLVNSKIIVTLDEQVISEGLFHEIHENDDKDMPFEVIWSRNVGLLSKGTHILVYEVQFTNRISDGVNQYGPGTKMPTLHDKCRVSMY